MDLRGSTQRVVVNLISQAIWVVLVGTSTVTLIFLFGTTDQGKIVTSSVQVPVWSILVTAFIALVSGLFLFAITRKSSAVRGRLGATRGNVALMRERTKVAENERMVRSTRFGRWTRGENLEPRTDFRQELNKAIMEEGAEVRRIWNLSSSDDVRRLREVIKQYSGRANHSIRAYFDLPDHALPELLIVDGRGASMSFPSSRSPHSLDWMIRFNRRDLILVIRDYFDVLWDRAERMLDAGEITVDCHRRLAEADARFRPSEDARNDRSGDDSP